MVARNEDAVLEVPPPVLRLIPVDRLLPHEEHDAQRGRPLLEKIAEADIWLHPPIVTPLPDDEEYFVVLDGANRCHTAAALGFPHILVQIVDYESGQVALDTWNHVISELPTTELMADLKKFPDVTVTKTDLLTARAQLAKRDALVYLIDFTDKPSTYIIRTDTPYNVSVRTERLREIVDSYKQRCVLDRINSSNLNHIRQMFPNINALVVFPNYQPSEILFAAREKVLLPPGISRHIIQGRAMRLLYPIQRLRDPDTPLDEKNRELQEWVVERTKARAVRFYAESIYLFDD